MLLMFSNGNFPSRYKITSFFYRAELYAKYQKAKDNQITGKFQSAKSLMYSFYKEVSQAAKSLKFWSVLRNRNTIWKVLSLPWLELLELFTCFCRLPT